MTFMRSMLGKLVRIVGILTLLVFTQNHEASARTDMPNPHFTSTIRSGFSKSIPRDVQEQGMGNIVNPTPWLQSLEETAIAAGYYHSCGLTSSGGVKCWGDNDYGQLGDNSTTQRLTPVDVSGLTSGVIDITSGYYHTCALTSSGGVKCWGRNNYGQLGDNSTTQRLTPVDVSSLSSGVVAIAGGYYHTCALTSDGAAKCWGYNTYGQLGDNSTTRRLTPVNVSGLNSSTTAIAAGQFHTCAVTGDGGVKCWGRNNYGQLGNGNTTQQLTPVDVSGLTSGGIAVATGYYHSCAIISGGSKCWGYNTYGQLGNGNTTQQLTPVDVSGLTSGVMAITTGHYHTCAVDNGGDPSIRRKIRGGCKFGRFC